MHLFKRSVIIGLGLTLDKLFLFILPYLLDSGSYNEFNRSYYLAGLIALFALLGFNFSIKSVRLKNILIFLLVFINSIASCLIILLFFQKGNFSLFPLVFAFFGVMITIFQFEFLFKSEVKKYLIALIYLFTAQVPTVATHIMTGLNLFYALTILYGLVFILILQLINEGEKHSKNDVVAFYTAGLSTFVINSSPVAILLLGKYIATVNFTIEIANSYVFASLLIAPMYFAGNIIERVIYTL